MKNLLSVEAKKYFKSIPNVFFALIFPLLLILIFYFTLDPTYLSGGYISIFILSASVPFISISINLCNDKISGILKSLFIIPKAFIKSLAAIFIIYFIGFLFSIILNTSLLLILKIDVSILDFFISFLFSCIVYLLGFELAIIISKLFNQMYTITPVTFIIFYLILFTSGITYPLHATLSWYYYLTFWSPHGVISYLINHSIGYLIFDNTLLFWVGLLLLLVYISGFTTWTYLIIKKYRYIL